MYFIQNSGGRLGSTYMFNGWGTPENHKADMEEAVVSLINNLDNERYVVHPAGDSEGCVRKPLTIEIEETDRERARFTCTNLDATGVLTISFEAYLPNTNLIEEVRETILATFDRELPIVDFCKTSRVIVAASPDKVELTLRTPGGFTEILEFDMETWKKFTYATFSEWLKQKPSCVTIAPETFMAIQQEVNNATYL